MNDFLLACAMFARINAASKFEIEVMPGVKAGAATQASLVLRACPNIREELVLTFNPQTFMLENMRCFTYEDLPDGQ